MHAGLDHAQLLEKIRPVAVETLESRLATLISASIPVEVGPIELGPVGVRLLAVHELLIGSAVLLGLLAQAGEPFGDGRSDLLLFRR